jgi:hypothetical protein
MLLCAGAYARTLLVIPALDRRNLGDAYFTLVWEQEHLEFTT